MQPCSVASRPAVARARTITAAAALALACLASPRTASAAACCLSATSFGVGRLLVWEDFAVGLQIGHARSLGQWDAGGTLRLDRSGFGDGLTRLEPWAIVRLHERIQLQARVPVLVEDREAGGLSQVAGGVGDVGAALRGELIPIGQYAGLPSLAFTLGALAPTGRRVEETSPPLFAGATGRGAWGLSLAAESEYASLPWFVRLDAGATLFLPFRRPDTGARQQEGPLLQAALSAGNEVLANRLVAAVALQGEWQGALRSDGAPVPGSSAFSLALSASLSWTADPHWTLVGTLTSNVWPDGAGKNRDARVGFTMGARYGHF